MAMDVQSVTASDTRELPASVHRIGRAWRPHTQRSATAQHSADWRCRDHDVQTTRTCGLRVAFPASQIRGRLHLNADAGVSAKIHGIPFDARRCDNAERVGPSLPRYHRTHPVFTAQTLAHVLGDETSSSRHVQNRLYYHTHQGRVVAAGGGVYAAIPPGADPTRTARGCPSRSRASSERWWTRWRCRSSLVASKKCGVRSARCSISRWTPSSTTSSDLGAPRRRHALAFSSSNTSGPWACPTKSSSDWRRCGHSRSTTSRAARAAGANYASVGIWSCPLHWPHGRGMRSRR